MGILPKILPILRIQIAPLKMPRPATSSLERGSFFCTYGEGETSIIEVPSFFFIMVSRRV